jgi:NAD(P)-dependent dehydrogenase (short-subunit alcohol dehydrogenase family)
MAYNQYADLFTLKNKVVMVAGGAGAIGSDMARAAAGFGAKIAIADFAEAPREEVVAALQAEGVDAVGVFANVLDPETVTAAISDAEQALGPLSVLINTVGTHVEQPAEEVSMDAWDKVVDVNLRGAFVLSQAAARSMIAHEVRGSIIHITSVRSGLGIRRGYAAYVASKGGLAILIKQLATEWARYGIRVNGIAPTFTRTALVADYLTDPDFYNPLVARIPLGRIAETDDLVGLAVFLASEASSLITGQNVFVDGGVTATQ